MQEIISNDMMRNADRYTIDTLGIEGTELMMRASRLVLAEVKNYDRIAIVAGKGNNGGDGICLAKLLIDAGISPDLYMFSLETRGESKYYFDMISDYPYIHIIDGNESFRDYDVVVDCIFGTGLARNIEGIYRTTIENINSSGVYVVSVDIPSGLNGDNGSVNGIAVKANKTVSINTRKLGQYLQNGKDYVGTLVCGDIGIVLNEKAYNLVEDTDIILPRRKHNSHKGTYGQISIIGGSRCYQGAPKLATMGTNALMSGAGLVRLCMPDELLANIAENTIECTLYPLSSLDGHIHFVEEEIQPLLSSDVIAIGVGISDNVENILLLEYLLKNYQGKLVIDADGINALSHDIGLLENKQCEVVLTPHVKEMSRLTGYSTQYVLDNAVNVAISFAKEHNVILLLKGTSTIVTDGEEVYIVDRGSPCMAKAGSGDVLTGVITGLLGNKNITTIQAAYFGAYIAGEAGEYAEMEYGTYGALARDTASNVSQVVSKYER